MRNLIAFTLVLLASLPTWGDTLQQKVAALDAVPGVLEAWIDREPEPVGKAGTLTRGVVAWYVLTDGTVKLEASDVLVSQFGVEGQEAAYWLQQIPAPLRPASEVKYLSSRTTGGWAGLTGAQQLSAISTFCNVVYASANAGASAIREIEVDPVDGTTIRVTGFFDIGTTWQKQEWYVRLIDANGSVAAPYSNIEFQRVAAAG